MKKLALLFAIFLTGCGTETYEVKNRYDIPKGLEDCSFYYLKNDLNGITVVRCPNSSVSVRQNSGKYEIKTVTVEIEKDTIQEKIDSIESILNSLKQIKSKGN